VGTDCASLRHAESPAGRELAYDFLRLHQPFITQSATPDLLDEIAKSIPHERTWWAEIISQLRAAGDSACLNERNPFPNVSPNPE